MDPTASGRPRGLDQTSVGRCVGKPVMRSSVGGDLVEHQTLQREHHKNKLGTRMNFIKEVLGCLGEAGSYGLSDVVQLGGKPSCSSHRMKRVQSSRFAATTGQPYTI